MKKKRKISNFLKFTLLFYFFMLSLFVIAVVASNVYYHFYPYEPEFKVAIENLEHKSPGDLDCPNGEITCWSGGVKECTTREECLVRISARNLEISLSATPTKASKTNSNTEESVAPSNTDPIVQCLISENCGGGSRMLTQSQCSNTVCCRRAQGSGQWVWYMDKTQCLADQESDRKWFAEEQNHFSQFMKELNSQNEELPNTTTNIENNYVYENPTKNLELVQKCIDNVNADLKSKMASCSFYGVGTAAFQCEESYKRQAELDKQNCY